MGDQIYRAYLSLLHSIRSNLEQMCELARKKIEAVRNDDLLALDEILKQEQALALDFRGLEQKRLSMLNEMGLGELRLSELSGYYPADMRTEVRKAVEDLQNQYQIYQNDAKVARNTLECSLHEIERTLASLGRTSEAGPGYGQGEVEPPRAMKTDFRA